MSNKAKKVRAGGLAHMTNRRGCNNHPGRKTAYSSGSNPAAYPLGLCWRCKNRAIRRGRKF